MAPKNPIREAAKAAVGRGVATLLPQCRYDRSLFVLAHMRCGTTALSNVLVSRPDVSGYGEAKIHHGRREALGRLVVNQARRKAWTPGAAMLFDKILHTEYDAPAGEAFFTARAIFLARQPGPTIRSICALYRMLGRAEYPDDTAAAEYYLARIERLIEMWHRFPPHRRVGLTHAELLADPDAALARISQRLTIVQPLENSYRSLEASRTRGGGDPTDSGRYSRIEPRVGDRSRGTEGELDLSPALRAACDAAYVRFETTVAAG